MHCWSETQLCRHLLGRAHSSLHRIGAFFFRFAQLNSILTNLIIAVRSRLQPLSPVAQAEEAFAMETHAP